MRCAASGYRGPVPLAASPKHGVAEDECRLARQPYRDLISPLDVEHSNRHSPSMVSPTALPDIAGLGYSASVPADPPSRRRLERAFRPYPTRTTSNAAAFGSKSSDSADPLVPVGAGRRHGSSGSP